MKKDECISKFVASLIIAFPFMAMLAFLVELFTIESFIEISKNHGSLIAGLIGFLGIFILVWNQNKSTKQTVEATLKAIHLESKEIDRRANKECIFRLIQIISNINRLSNITDIQLELHKAIDESTQLTIMNNREDSPIEYSRLEFIHSILLFYQILIKYRNSTFHSQTDLIMKGIKRNQASISKRFNELVIKKTDDDYNISGFLNKNLFYEESPDGNLLKMSRIMKTYRLDENVFGTMKYIVFLLKDHLIEFKLHVDRIDFN